MKYHIETAVSVENEAATKFTLPKLPLKLNKKLLGLGGAALAIILVLAILISTLFADEEPNCSLCMKDSELMPVYTFDYIRQAYR